MSRRISSTAMPGDVRLWVLRGASSLWPPLLYQRFDSLLFPEGDVYLFDYVYCTRDAMTCQCSGRMCQGAGKPAPANRHWYRGCPVRLEECARAGASPRPYPIRLCQPLRRRVRARACPRGHYLRALLGLSSVFGSNAGRSSIMRSASAMARSSCGSTSCAKSWGAISTSISGSVP